MPIWNNLSEKADIKLQKVQKSLVKGATAVVSVVNNLITAPGMPSKNEVVNNLMDGVLLLANANMELNVCRREVLRPELNASYRYCERLAETRVNLPIWNNLSEKADIKLQKVQKSLVKGATAVASVVNNLITAPGMPSKNEVVNNLMDGVLLLANANMELNVCRREALRPELNASYRYLCAPSNPISSELFGDDLPKAVKDITDTNRITSKLQ